MKLPKIRKKEVKMKNNKNLIKLAEKFVKEELEFDPSGHDWWHCNRVRNIALEIAKNEKGDFFICELAALLHDIADEKINESKQIGLDKVRNWMRQNIDDKECIDKVMSIISSMSYNGGQNKPMETIEGQIVQDADRLDALGAIGIARTFVYSGWKGQQIHNPDRDPANTDYRSNEKTAIYHFYEKLLKIKDLLNTNYAKEIAQKRHKFMEEYLSHFYSEWNFKD
ncbi:HD domain-containing protein [Fontibacillus panacisegetis]|nr:HD domain-containing protein [Fontibacillus panacisegetis]